MSVIALDWQSFSGWLVVGLFSAVLSYFSCVRAMLLARKSGMISQPGERQSHEVATPTGGGLGLVFSVVVTSIALHFMLPLPGFWWQSMLPGVLLQGMTAVEIHWIAGNAGLSIRETLERLMAAGFERT